MPAKRLGLGSDVCDRAAPLIAGATPRTIIPAVTSIAFTLDVLRFRRQEGTYGAYLAMIVA